MVETAVLAYFMLVGFKQKLSGQKDKISKYIYDV